MNPIDMSNRQPNSGRPELTWTNRDKGLLAYDDTPYEWWIQRTFGCPKSGFSGCRRQGSHVKGSLSEEDLAGAVVGFSFSSAYCTSCSVAAHVDHIGSGVEGCSWPQTWILGHHSYPRLVSTSIQARSGGTGM